MASQAVLAYRLQGIPNEYDRNGVRDIVCRLLNLDLRKVVVRSLAQYPLKDDEKVATLSFLEIPDILEDRQKAAQWMFDISDTDRGFPSIILTLDTHFQGFTPLPGSEDEECDIE